MDSTTQVNLTCLRLSEGSQSWKGIYCMIPLIWHFEQTKLWGKKHISSFQGLGLGGGLDYKGQQHIWSEGTILDFDGGNGFIKICRTVPLKSDFYCTYI